MRQLLLLAGGVPLRWLCVGCAPAAATASTSAKIAPATDDQASDRDLTKTIVLWPRGAPGALGTSDGDVPKLYVYPATGPGLTRQ